MSTNSYADIVNNRISPEILDRQPPRDLDAERGVLGSIILKPEICGDVFKIVAPDDFYDEANRKLFSHMLGINAGGRKVDSTLLRSQLDSSGEYELIGGAGYIAEIIRSVPHAENAKHYAGIVREHSQKRRLIGLGTEILRSGYNGIASDDLLGLAERRLGTIRGNGAESQRFERLTSAELAAYDEEIEYLIDDVWPAAQGGIISGRFKTLKTNFAIAMGMSASLGISFLNRFHVGRAIRVGVMSAESGAKTLRDRGQAIAASMGVGLADCSNLIWSTASPRLARVDHLAALKQFILDDGLEGLIVDPTYLALCDIGSDSSNVFKMGAVLAPITALIQETACSIVLVNHNIKGRSKDLARFDAPDLGEVSMSGFMEWARFWCLLGPRQEWSEDTGEHWLWLRTGGSAGHAGLWHMDVAEGKRSDPGGRRWEVSIIGATEGKRNTAIEREAAKQEERQEAHRIKIAADKVAILNAAATTPAGDTERELKRRSRVRTERFNEAFSELTGDKQLIPCKVLKGNNRTYDGFRIPPDPKDDPLAHLFSAGGSND